MIGSPTVGNVFGEVMAFIPLFPSLTGLVEGCSQSHYLHIILGYALEDQENSYYVRESSQAEKKKKNLHLGYKVVNMKETASQQQIKSEKG